MKIKNLLFSLSIVLILTFSLGLVSADKTVNYTVYGAIVEDDGSLTTSIGAVNNFDAILYACTAVDCITVNPVSLGTFHTNSNVISITFPEVLVSTNGYVIYVYKDGFIGWEQSNVIRYGNGDVVSSTPFYLSKKANGFAPIMNLSVVDSVPQNTPIRVGLDISVDATTYSAIMLNTNSNIPLNEEVETLVTVSVSNSTGIVYTATQTVNIDYSGSEQVEFTFPGLDNIGAYTVSASTQVTDEKILHSITQTTNSAFSVIPQNLTNYTSTVISGLSNTPALPRLGDNVLFTFDYVSGYIDELGLFNPASTTVDITVTRNNVLVNNTIENLGSSGTYNITIPFNQIGNYLITVTGFPNDSRGNQSFPWTQTLTFTVNPELVDDPGTDNHHHSTVEDKKSNVKSVSLIASEPLNGDAIDLTPEANKKSFFGSFLFWLVLFVILLLIAVITTYVVKYVF